VSKKVEPSLIQADRVSISSLVLILGHMRKLLVIFATLALLLPAAAGSAASERSTTRVSAFSNFFTPKSVTVGQGGKVTWTVRRGVHNVVGSGFKSPFLSKGKSFSKKFNRRGTFRYVCTIHSGMKGKVVVR